MTPSRICSVAASRLQTLAARSSRSLRSLSAALQMAAPCKRDGPAAEPLVARRRESVSPQSEADVVAGREAQHLGDHMGERRAGVRPAVGQRDLHRHVAIGT